MSLDRTWYTRAEIPIADFSTTLLKSQSLFFGIKAMLKHEYATGTVGVSGAPPAGATWTCEGSSDSFTAAMDGTDRLTAVFDATKVVPHNDGSAHSWIVLKSPVALGPYYLCLNFNGSTNGTTMTAVGSKTAFAGGNTTTRPTSAAEFIIFNSSQFNEGSSATDHRMGIVQSANGAFYMLINKVGAGFCNYFLSMFDVDQARAGDVTKVIGWSFYVNSGKGAPNSDTMAGRTYDNSSAAALITSYNGTWGGSGLLNAIDSQADGYPLWIMGYSSLGGMRGAAPDVRCMPFAAIQGRSIPTVGTIERIVSGHFAFPWGVPLAL